MASWQLDWRSGMRLAAARLAFAVVVFSDDAAGQNTPDPLAQGPSITTWKTITLVTHRSVAALRKALDTAQCRIGSLADEILDQPAFALSETETQVDLALISVADLGFTPNGASLAQVHERAQQLGLELCPAEIAPLLRLQYVRQPRGEFLRIAIEPATTARGSLATFIVGNGGDGLLLIAGDGRPDLVVPSSALIVFIRPVIAADAPSGTMPDMP